MTNQDNPFLHRITRGNTQDDRFSREELTLANRNSGLLLELLNCDITPTGAHYLLNHFDVPVLDKTNHSLSFAGGFENPYSLLLDDIKSLDKITQPVTLECAGNGRAGLQPRSSSMPWMYEAVGTYEWTGTLLKPLIEKAAPKNNVVEISFSGADKGFDAAIEHNYARSLTLEQLEELGVMLVYEMNGQDLLPQHGAPLRIVVPGWYGMASVKWLFKIEALTSAFEGFQQVGTYHFKSDDEDNGQPVQDIRVKSLMMPPGVPDWYSRKRLVDEGPVSLIGRAWSGGGRVIKKVEVEIDGVWQQAKLSKQIGPFAWVKWQFEWMATSGEHCLRCRATDSEGHVQPLSPSWDLSGFGNNMVHEVTVEVRGK